MSKFLGYFAVTYAEDNFATASSLDRRYNQLTDMMLHHNPDFDERKYWTYGCNCLVLG